MELEDAVEEQYFFEEYASSRFSYVEEESTNRPELFTDFDNRDIALLRAVIHDSVSLSEQLVREKKVKLDVPDGSFAADDVSSLKKDPSAISTHIRPTKYKRYSEDQYDGNLEVEPFNDDQWVREEQSEITDQELADFRSGLRFSLLDNLAELPDIEEISSSLSEKTITFVEERSNDNTLIGKFVDPLTGLDIVEPEHSQRTDDSEYDFVELEEFEEYDIEQAIVIVDVTEDSELLELENWDADMNEIDATKVVQADDGIIEFQFPKQVLITSDLQFDQALFEDTQRQNESIVSAFVEELLQLVVEAEEYKDPKEVLRKTIDKRKLMDDLNVRLRELEVEQSLRLYLNRKVIDHHKRKRIFRAIIDDAPENIEYLMAKYEEQLQRYDKIKGKEEELKTVIKSKTAELNEVLAEKEQIFETKVKEFEELVKKALLPKQDATETTNVANHKDTHQEHIRNINLLLNKFTAFRREISKSRLVLIKKQHLFAELTEELNRVQNLGNGLHLSQFENLQNEVTQLSKKTEERNTELAKARIRRQLDVHISTHMKERTLMLRDTLAVQKLSYRTLLQERDETRRRLYKQKMMRARIRKEGREYDFQGGILSKPELMLDYDHTVEEVMRKEEIVKGLRSQYKKINEKIVQYEQLLKSGFQNKFVVEE